MLENRVGMVPRAQMVQTPGLVRVRVVGLGTAARIVSEKISGLHDPLTIINNFMYTQLHTNPRLIAKSFALMQWANPSVSVE